MTLNIQFIFLNLIFFIISEKQNIFNKIKRNAKDIYRKIGKIKLSFYSHGCSFLCRLFKIDK